jgi:TRAP-type C4-dicarboxylate transport system permease small subunit
MNLLKKIDTKFEEIFCSVILALMLVILTYQVVLRFIFNNSNAWSEELARYMFIWFIFVGASYAAQKLAHIKIDALINLYPERVRKYVWLMGVLVWIGFNVIVIITSGRYAVVLHRADQVSLGLGIKMSYVYAAIPVGYLLMTFRLLQNLYKTIFSAKTNDGGEK